MGSPKYPTDGQIALLRKAAGMGPPEMQSVHNNRLRLTIPPMGLAVVEIPEQSRASAEHKP
jgi:hypothetical protein